MSINFEQKKTFLKLVNTNFTEILMTNNSKLTDLIQLKKETHRQTDIVSSLILSVTVNN